MILKIMDKCNEYNVVMPVVYKDFSFMRKTIKYVLSNLSPKKIFLLTDIRFSSYIPSEISVNDKIVVIDENRIVDGLTYNRIDELLKKQDRKHTKTGWYFQQFLKMGFSLSEYCDSDFYLVWDSDTIPLRKIHFFDDQGHPYFSMKTEYHVPYFDTIYRLLGVNKLNAKSYIAEHMMFSSEVMRKLIEKINDSDVIGDCWYEKIINSLVEETISPFSFSEFETYGTFTKLYYPDLYRERQISGMRRGGLIQGRFVSERIINELANDMDVASFEIYDRPPFPWGVFCQLYENYQKFRESQIRRKF